MEDFTYLIFCFGIIVFLIYLPFYLRKQNKKRSELRKILAHFDQKPVAVLNAISTEKFIPVINGELNRVNFFDKLQYKIDQILSTEQGRQAFLKFHLVMFGSIAIINKEKLLHWVIQVPGKDPGNAELTNETLQCIKKNWPATPKTVAEGVYDVALMVLENNPEQSHLKRFVLEIGRLHYGKQRGGNVTIYDESAIQNDILVRTGQK